MDNKPYYTADELQGKFKKDKIRHILFTVVCSLVCLVIGISGTAAVMNNVGGNKPTDANVSKFQEVYNIIKDEWYFGDLAEDESVYVDRALQAMVNEQQTDSYLKYNAIPDSESNVTYGLGVSVAAYDGYLIIAQVYSNSPASNVGLQKGDIITSVNSTSIRYLALTEVSKMIQGDYHTTVEIEVIRNNEHKKFTVTRNTWKEDSVFSLDKDNYAILQITGFDDNTSVAADNILASLTDSKRTTKVQNLIIDLRDNPGGYVMVFTQLADLFTPKGTVFGRYEFKDSAKSYDVSATSGQKYNFDHIYILVNGNSASASESFTAALKDNLSNVTVVGTNTYGKGIAQKTITFNDGSSLKYTYAEYYRKGGVKLHKIGVAPDVKIEEVGPHVIWDKDYGVGETFESRMTTYLINSGYVGTDYVSLLKNYQSQKGLSVTGTYDVQTEGSINKDIYDQRESGAQGQLDKLIQMIGG